MESQYQNNKEVQMDEKFILIQGQCDKNGSNKLSKFQFKIKQKNFPWFMYFSGLTANLLLLTTGMCMVWMSPVLSKIKSNNTSINPLGVPVTVTEVSIIAALPQIAAPIGLILAAKMSDILGRKRSLMIVAIAFICSISMVAFSRHVYFYYIFSLLTGLCVSGTLVCVPVFNSEIANDENRGKILCLTGLGMPTGNLLAYIFGPITSVSGFFLTCTVPAVAHLILSTGIPESPIFLALKGRKLECNKALEKLRNPNNDTKIEAEYNKIEGMRANSSCKENRNFLDIFRNRTPRKAFLICIAIIGVQQFSGIFVLLAFMAPIFEKASNISGDSFGIIVGVVQLLVFLVAASFVDKLGRRPLILISSITCSIALFILGLHFYFQTVKAVFFDNITWLPILGIVIHIIGYGLGLGPIPIGLIGELFPNDLRAIGTAAILVSENAAIFINMLGFPLVTEHFGVHYCFWFYSSACFLGFLLMYFVLPETKGKSFLEIQKILDS